MKHIIEFVKEVLRLVSYLVEEWLQKLQSLKIVVAIWYCIFYVWLVKSLLPSIQRDAVLAGVVITTTGGFVTLILSWIFKIRSASNGNGRF